MIRISDPTLARDLKEGTVNKEQLSKYLLTNHTAVDLADALADELMGNVYGKKITLTKAQFLKHFSVAGIKMDENGNLVPELRGQGRWKSKDV